MKTIGLNIIKLFIAIVLCFSSSFTFAQKAFKNEADLIKTADRLYENEEYEKAFEYYQTLLSNHKNNPAYNLRYGVCLLHSDRSDPERPIYFLKKAAEYNEIDNSVYYFLGLSYHVNYRFLEAIEMYEKYEKIAKNRNVEKYNVERRIQECNHGLQLFSNIRMLYVLNKVEVKADFYYRNYEMNKTNGRVIILPEKLQSKYDEKNLKVKTAFYIPQDRLIFFASYGRKGETGLDIYRAKQNLDGDWYDIEKLDNNINTKFDDAHPFLTKNGKTLYFSSKGHNTIGGFDIFKADFNMSSFSYSKPENVNFPINTPYDDIFFAPDTSNKYAYFSSNRNSRSNLIQVYKIGINKRPPEVNNLAQALSKEESMVFEAEKIRELAKLQRNTDDYKYDNEIPDSDDFYEEVAVVEKAEDKELKLISASDLDGLSRAQILDTAFDKYKALKYKTIELKKNKQIVSKISNKYKLKAKNAIQSGAENAQEDFISYSSNASIADDISNDLEEYIQKAEFSTEEIMILISKIQQNTNINSKEAAQIVVKIDSIYNDAYPGKKVFEDVIKQKEKLLALEEKEAMINKSELDKNTKEIAELESEVKEYKTTLKTLSDKEDIKEYKEIIEVVENKKSNLQNENQLINEKIAQNESKIDSLKIINKGAAELRKELDNKSLAVNTKTGSGIDESVKREIVQDIFNKKKSTEGAEIQIAENQKSDNDSSDFNDEGNVIISESYDIQEKKQKDESQAKINDFKKQVEITQNKLNEKLDSVENMSNSAYNYAESLIEKSKITENQIALMEDSLRNNPKIQNQEKLEIVENIKASIKEKASINKNIEYSYKIAKEYEKQYAQLSNKSAEIENLKNSLDTLSADILIDDLNRFEENITEITDSPKLNLENKIAENNKELIADIESNYSNQKSENKDLIKSYIAENKSSDKQKNNLDEWEAAFNEELNQIAEAEAKKDSLEQITVQNEINNQKITELETQLDNTLAIVNKNKDTASNMANSAILIAENLISESDFREKEISQIEAALKEKPDLPESQTSEIINNIKKLKSENIDAKSKINKLYQIANEYENQSNLLAEKASQINDLKDSLADFNNNNNTSDIDINSLSENIQTLKSDNPEIDQNKTELLTEVKEYVPSSNNEVDQNKTKIESFIAENSNTDPKETQIKEWETQFKAEINQILKDKSQAETTLAEQNNLQTDSLNQEIELAETQIAEDTNFVNNQSETELAEQNNLQTDSLNQEIELAETQITEDTNSANNQAETELAEQNNLQTDSLNQEIELAETQIDEDTNSANNQAETELAEQNNLQTDSLNQEIELAETQIAEDTNSVNNQAGTELAEQNNLQDDSLNQEIELAETQIAEDTNFVNNQAGTELAEQNNLQDDSLNQEIELAETQITEDTNFVNNQAGTGLAEQNNLQDDSLNQEIELAETQITEDTNFVNNQDGTGLAEQNNLQDDSLNQQSEIAETQITEDTNFVNNQAGTGLAEQNNLQDDSLNQQSEQELAIIEDAEEKLNIDSEGNISVTEYKDERKNQLAQTYIKPKVDVANDLNGKSKELSQRIINTEQRAEEYKAKAQQKHNNAELAYQNYLNSDNESTKDSLAKLISKNELEAQALSKQAEISEEVYEIQKTELSSVNEKKNSLIEIIKETNNEIAAGNNEISEVDISENIISSEELLKAKESELIAENQQLQSEIQELETEIEKLEINKKETEIEAAKLLVKADEINNPNRKAKFSEQAEQSYQNLNNIENNIALNQDKKQILESQIDQNNTYLESLNQEFNAENSSEITMNFDLKQSDILAKGSPILAKLDSIEQAENKDINSAKRLNELDLLYIKKGIISKTNKINQAKLNIFENKLDNEEIEFNLQTNLENNIASLNTKIDSLNDIELDLNAKINQLESQGFTSDYSNEFASVDLVYSNLNQQASELNSEADSLYEIAEVKSRKERKQIIQKADADRIQAYNMEVMAEEFNDLYLESEYAENDLIIEEFYLKSTEDISLKKANEIIENSIKNHNRSKESFIAATNPKLSKSDKRNLYNQAVKLKQISVNQQQQAIDYYSDVNPNLAYSSEEMRLIEKPDSAIAISEESIVIAENNQLNIDESEASETEKITDTEDGQSQQNQAESAENVSLNESTEVNIEQSEQLNQQEINEESVSENQTQLIVEVSSADQVDDLEVDEVLSFDLSTTTNQEIIRKVEIRKADYIGVVVDNELAIREEFYNEANPIEEKEVDITGLVYKIQIAALRRVVSGKEFPGIKPLSIENIEGSTYKRYMAGLFTDYNEAVLARNQIRTLGYSDAFVVPYFNGERITNAKARSLIAQGVAYTDESLKEIAVKANKPTLQVDKTQAQAAAQAQVNDILDLSSDLFYTVQIGVYGSPRTSQRLNYLPNLFFDRLNNGYYRYFSGVFPNIEAARQHIQIAKNRGFNDAFVVAFHNNQKVSTAQARNLESQGVNTIRPESSSQQMQEQRAEPEQQESTEEENTESQIGTQEVEVLRPNESSTESNSESSGSINIVFKVQIGAYQNEIPIDVVNQFLEIQTSIEKSTTDAGLTVYRTGNFTDYQQANEFKNQIVAMGITDAFVVALRNGERISIQQALELISE